MILFDSCDVSVRAPMGIRPRLVVHRIRGPGSSNRDLWLHESGKALGENGRVVGSRRYPKMVTNEQTDFPLPPGLPRPLDDGAAAHLLGMSMPQVVLSSTRLRVVDLSSLSAPTTVIYCYPMTGVPGQPLPGGWDLIPGARGCTPQACNFRDHYRELSELKTEVYGLSTQTTQYQREMTDRLHLPFEVLSDAEFKLCDALRLPTFEVDGMRLMKRLTLIVRGGRIEQVFYPVFPPNESANQVLHWLRAHPIPA
jgi:peroxiredoxin